MPLMLDNMRAEFARHLAGDPQARFSMDKALAHVITIAYERGLDDGRRDSNRDAAQQLVRDILDPEMYGHAVTQEVRDAALKCNVQVQRDSGGLIAGGSAGTTGWPS